jgi:hypothetical protein
MEWWTYYDSPRSRPCNGNALLVCLSAVVAHAQWKRSKENKKEKTYSTGSPWWGAAHSNGGAKVGSSHPACSTEVHEAVPGSAPASMHVYSVFVEGGRAGAARSNGGANFT